MVTDGVLVPDFELQLDDGQSRPLSSLKGRPVVLYFYPKDDTSGCTLEAKDFSCLLPDFKKAGVEVIGISPDDAASHHKFREKHELTVQLASDPEERVELVGAAVDAHVAALMRDGKKLEVTRLATVYVGKIVARKEEVSARVIHSVS